MLENKIKGNKIISGFMDKCDEVYRIISGICI